MNQLSSDIMKSVNTRMEEIFGAPPASAIEDATVYEELLPNNNRVFKKRFFGKNRELVVKRAARAVVLLDYMRSPHSSVANFIDGNWSTTVTWYSLD